MDAARPDSGAARTLRGRRVVFVFGSLELGGAERQALILARHLSAYERAEVEVWGFNQTGPAASLCERHGLRWRVVPFPFAARPARRLASLFKLARTLLAARPDVLLPYTLIPNVACGSVWELTGARLCVWNQRDEGIARATPAWERWAARRTPRFISNSRRGARFLVDELGVSASKVTVIHNGVERPAPAASRDEWRRRLQLTDDCFVACMVANLHRHKSHDTLLAAWRKVSETLEARVRDAVLLLAGRYDDAYASLADLARELGIGRGVRFMGHIADVAGLLGASDIGVFSSRSEGCPNGVLEGMAAGLAVAGTDTDGIREALGPAGAPFLAAPGDTEALARVILKLANDAALRSAVGAENLRRARDVYDPARMCEETAALLVSSL
jgi:glycosyltransferase involved in cell wall biosynthesis